MWLLLGTFLWSLCLCTQTSIFRANGDWLLQIKKQLVISTFSATGGRGCGGELFATRKFNSPFKKFKTRLSSPNNTYCAGNFSLGKVVIFPLPPSGIPTPLPGNYGKVPYTPFATREMYPLHIPTQRILGMKISVIVRVSLLILHPNHFYSKSYNMFCCPFIYSTLVKTWSPLHSKPEKVPLSGTSSYMLSQGIPLELTPEAPCFLWKLAHTSKYN